MAETVDTTLLVIGGGPGGYVAAIRAGQLGIPTVLVERAQLGGTCLNVGCIPSKAMIHLAGEFAKAMEYANDSPLGIQADMPKLDLGRSVAWKDGIVRKLTGGVALLLKKQGVRVLQGDAKVIDGKSVEVRVDGDDEPIHIRCDHLLLAAGSEPIALATMPFGGNVVSSTEALSPDILPKRLVVVGAGYIGLELGTVYRKLGTEVTVIEAQDRILPAYDPELVRPVSDALAKQGVHVLLENKVLGLSADGLAVRVQNREGAEQAVPADRVLVAVGRRPRLEGWGLETLGLEHEGRAIKIDERCRTSMRGVWAIGDLTGEPMLAHRAMAQGEMVAELIAGKHRRFVPAAIPSVCFTDPEIVTAGISPADAQALGIDCISASFPFAANGRAMTIETTEGFVRVVARRDNHLIVGWQAVGGAVSELAAVFSHSLEMGERLEDVSSIIHAHPTLGEAVQESAMRALGHALHV